VVRKDLGPELCRAIAHDLRESIEYSLAHRDEALDHALRYAGGLARGQADEFVGMYVNQRTVDWGDEGREAVRRLLREGYEQGIIPHVIEPEFVD
jgi:1,4-dihydroxy-6-naphthoate synthase